MDGSVDIEGTVSYASQEPWIFSGTIKENILFGKPFDRPWFNKVVECCCLEKVSETLYVTGFAKTVPNYTRAENQFIAEY